MNVNEENTNIQVNANVDEVPENIKNDGIALDDVYEYSANTSVTEPQNTDKTYSVRIISATSKVSVQLNDVWYAFSFSETRDIHKDENMNKERADLWDTVNAEVDNQVQYVLDTLKNPGAVQQ